MKQIAPHEKIKCKIKGGKERKWISKVNYEIGGNLQWFF